MNTQTATAERFTLDEAKAQEWLRRSVAVYEGGGAPDDGEHLADFGEIWDPVGVGNEKDVYQLVRNAVYAGIIGRPDSYDIDFEYADDEDGGYYFFLVRVGDGLNQIKLASFAHEMRKLGERDAVGAAAALAILREAVSAANGVLRNLDEYVASRQDDPDCE